MSESETVYDLGEVVRKATADPGARSRSAGASPTMAATIIGGKREDARAGRVVVHRDYGPGSPRPAVAASASLLLPGTGQVVAGDAGLGVFVLTSLGFVSALIWAIFETFDRILPTLAILDLPTRTPLLVLVLLFLSAAALHIGGAVHAQAQAERIAPSRAVHPVVSGIASGIVPGWGQLMNGHRARAVVFLAGLWLVGGGALLMTPPRHPAMHELGSWLPVGPASRWGVAILLTTAALLWALAVYDAVMGALSRRRG